MCVCVCVIRFTYFAEIKSYPENLYVSYLKCQHPRYCLNFYGKAGGFRNITRDTIQTLSTEIP